MQPVSATEGDGVRKLKGDLQEGPVNEQSWWKRSAASVPVDQIFFHKYFSQKHEKEKAKASKARKRRSKTGNESGDSDEDIDVDIAPDGDGSEDDSDAEEAEIWKAMKASMPRIGDDDGVVDDMSNADDDDSLPSDLPSDFGGSDSDDDGTVDGDIDSLSIVDNVESDAEGGGHGSDDGFSLAEDSDADDLVPLDEEAPDGLIHWDGTDASDNDDADAEWGGFAGSEPSTGGGKKRKQELQKEKVPRKKLRSLPTFASYEDYAKMIEDAPEDNI